MKPKQIFEEQLSPASSRHFKWLCLSSFVVMLVALITLIAFGRTNQSTMKDEDWAKWAANALPQHMQDEMKPKVEELKEYHQWRAQEAARHAKAVKSARCKSKADNYADDLNSCGVRASQMGRDPIVACAHILNRFAGDAIQGQFGDC